MDNAGFSNEDTKVTVVEVETSLSDHSQQNGDIQTGQQHSEVLVPAVATAVAAAASGTSHCNAALCEEAKTQCSCPVQSKQQKVELQSWVHPKGWVLLGTALCLIAWIVVYFTVTHFYEA